MGIKPLFLCVVVALVGKSIMSASIVKSATDKKNRVLFLVHRNELLNQIMATYEFAGVDFSLCDFSMVQTYRRHMKPPNYYQLIIVDECHLNHKAYGSIVEHHKDAKVIGWTATPMRLGSGGLGDVYGGLVEGVSTKWLIDNQFLAPYKYYSVRLADTSGIHTKQGDYDKHEVAELMQDKEIYGETVKQWQRLAPTKKTIVYCASIQASRATCAEFLSMGVSCVHLDGSSPTAERERAMEGFRSGEVQVLCNMGLFGEGLDVPDCGCVVLLRPTKSLALYIQMAMRSMRYQAVKTAIIIDHVGNCYTHGLPDDKREWSLETKKKQECTVKIKECPNCYAVYEPSRSCCPFCGTATHMVKETKGKNTIDVDLVEVERVEGLKSTPMREFHGETFDEVKEYQKLRGYKFAWVLRYCKEHGIKIPQKYNYMLTLINI